MAITANNYTNIAISADGLSLLWNANDYSGRPYVITVQYTKATNTVNN